MEKRLDEIENSWKGKRTDSSEVGGGVVVGRDQAKKKREKLSGTRTTVR